MTNLNAKCRNSEMFEIIVNLRTVSALCKTYREKLYNLPSKRPFLPCVETSW